MERHRLESLGKIELLLDYLFESAAYFPFDLSESEFIETYSLEENLEELYNHLYDIRQRLEIIEDIINGNKL